MVPVTQQAAGRRSSQCSDHLLEVLRKSVQNLDLRRGEQVLLAQDFRRGLDIVTNLSLVNRHIDDSIRPELTLSDPVEQMKIFSLDDLKRLNNFKSRMRGFGPPIFEEKEGKSVFLGRRYPDEQELVNYFVMGARGSLTSHVRFAKKNGISKEVAEDMFFNSLVAVPAFMRMWIVLPDLTQRLMTRLLCRTYGPGDHYDREEMFVAYSLMSGFVDRKDPDVVDSTGVDLRYLCR